LQKKPQNPFTTKNFTPKTYLTKTFKLFYEKLGGGGYLKD